MTKAEIAKAEREVVEAVRLAYYELWLADELIRIVEDNKELVNDPIKVSEARYKTGGSQQDVLHAELEGDKLEDQLISLRRQKEQDRLRGLLRREVAAAYAAIEQLELFRDRLVPRTEQTLEIATADYQGEKNDFTDLIDIYRDLLSLEVQVARTKATLASTLAQIERTVGCEVGEFD